MVGFLSLLLHVLISPFKTQARLEAEIVLLRHQLNVPRARARSTPKLTVADRLLFVWLYRLLPSMLSAVTIIQPETVLRWHRTGFRLYWRWKSRSRGGRPKIPGEIRRLIRDMSLANRLWGAPRIHGELRKLGIEVAQSTVAKYMAKWGRGRSQTWKTFLRNHAAGIAAMDFLVVPTVGFKLLFVLVILRYQRRRLISLSVTINPTAEWIAHQITDAFPWNDAPDLSLPKTSSTLARGARSGSLSRNDRVAELVLHILVSPFKAQARLEAEILVLRHQLNILHRQAPKRPRLTVADRLIFVWLYRLFPSVLNAVSMIEPETVLRWHRMGFRLYWRWKSRAQGGRPRIPGDIRRLALATCVGSLVPTPAITTNSERICRWTKIRRTVGPFNGVVNSPRGRFSADFIMNSAGRSFW
jgi:hypothetical protein